MNIESKSLFLANLVLKIRPLELALLLKWLFRIKRYTIHIASVYLWLDPASNFGKRLLTHGCYEPEVTDTIKGLLKPGDIFIDLGGNEAYYSLIASKIIGKTGNVYCIEPQQRLWPVIFRNLYLNKVTNCTLIPYCIGSQNNVGKITLFSSINSGASSLVNSYRTFLFPKQEVVFLGLDTLFDLYNINKIKLIKIDIEGYEFEALKTASRILDEKRVANLLVELHPLQLKALNQSTTDVFDYMRDKGYSHKVLNDVNLFYIP